MSEATALPTLPQPLLPKSLLALQPNSGSFELRVLGSFFNPFWPLGLEWIWAENIYHCRKYHCTAWSAFCIHLHYIVITTYFLLWSHPILLSAAEGQGPRNYLSSCWTGDSPYCDPSTNGECPIGHQLLSLLSQSIRRFYLHHLLLVAKCINWLWMLHREVWRSDFFLQMFIHF